jgi:SAM-dependent methyltransferase
MNDRRASRFAPHGAVTPLFCPACGALSEHCLLYAKNGCDIFRCTGCGLGRAQANGFDPGTYYTRDYFCGGRADGYADYRGAQAVLRHEFARTVDFIRAYRAGGRLLEIGCAYGFFLDEAKPHFDVIGIELAEDAAAACRQRGLDVRSGVADAQMMARIGMVDVVVLLDVIEHLPDPQATLGLAARHLRPGGVIVLTTGDFASLYARLGGAGWRLMTPPQHLWYFTPTSLARMARGIGLAMERCDHPWKFVPASLILFQVGRMLGLDAVKRIGTGRLSRLGVPVNLFDAMRVVLRKDAAAKAVHVNDGIAR